MFGFVLAPMALGSIGIDAPFSAGSDDIRSTGRPEFGYRTVMTERPG